MDTDPQSETKIQLPITLTVEDLENLLAHFASWLNLSLKEYADNADNANKEMSLKHLKAVITVAYNIATVSEDLIKQLKNQE